MLECQSLMEKLSPFMDMASLEIESMRKIKRPKRFSDDPESSSSSSSEAAIETTSSSSSSSSSSSLGFPVLPEEPNRDSSDRSVLCRIRVRLPDGKRIQRNFNKSESVQLLWSFCYSQIDESERKPFKLIQAIPGDYKTLHYGSYTTFEQSGLSNSLVSLTWA